MQFHRNSSETEESEEEGIVFVYLYIVLKEKRSIKRQHFITIAILIKHSNILYIKVNILKLVFPITVLLKVRVHCN